MNVKHILLLYLSAPCIFSQENGTADSEPELRIIGGSYAQDGQYPYHVSIMVDGEFRCGGSLISKMYVLTAGHCFISKDGYFDANDIKILIGHTSIRDKWNAKIIIGVDKVFIPRTFSQSNGFYIINDIAVLKLSMLLEIPNNWLLSVPEHRAYDGELAVVTGHGLNWKISYNPSDPRSPHVGGSDGLLRHIDVGIITNDECRSAWGSNYELPKSLVCVQTGVRQPGSLCNGDSGGPLVVGKTIVGVLSSGGKSCRDKLPEVFTRVSSHMDFIYKSINESKDPNIVVFNMNYNRYQVY